MIRYLAVAAAALLDVFLDLLEELDDRLVDMEPEDEDV